MDSVFSGLFVEKTFLSPSTVLGTFVEKSTDYICEGLFLGPLFYCIVLMLVTYFCFVLKYIFY